MAMEVCPAYGGVRSSDYHSCYRCNGAGYIEVGGGSSSSSSSGSSSSGSSPSSGGYDPGRGSDYTPGTGNFFANVGVDANVRGEWDKAIAECTEEINSRERGLRKLGHKEAAVALEIGRAHV